jgi:hypothetical protein
MISYTFSYTDPYTGVARSGTYLAQRARNSTRRIWQAQPESDILEYIGSSYAREHTYHRRYILDQDVEIESDAHFDALQRAHEVRASGTWSDGTTSYDDVIITAFDVLPIDGLADEYNGTMTFRRMRG